MSEAWKIILKGEVQGVGVRATAASIARKMGLSGYAKNLSNGDVEIYAQGSKNEAESLINGLKKFFTFDVVYFEKIRPLSKNSFEIL